MKKSIIGTALILSTLLTAFATPVLAAGKSLKIAMLLWRGETAAEKGFKDGLAEMGYSVEYVVLNAEQDKGKLANILRKDLNAQLGSIDYVYSFGTTISKATNKFLKGRTPLLFNIVADPLKAGLVASMSGSGANVGGATHTISAPLQIENSRKLIGYQKLGVFFNPKEENSVAAKGMIEALGQSMGFEVVDIRTAPKEAALKASLKKIADRKVAVDAVYFPTDSFLVSNAALIGAELSAAKVKSIGAIGKYVKKGALMGTVADYHNMGKLVAGIVDRNQKGEALKTIAVQTEKEPMLIINKKTADAIGVDIPGDLIASSKIVE